MSFGSCCVRVMESCSKLDLYEVNIPDSLSVALPHSGPNWMPHSLASPYVATRCLCPHASYSYRLQLLGSPPKDGPSSGPIAFVYSC